jgi:YggT family protein
VGEFLSVFIQLFVTALWLVVVARILIGWFNPTFGGPVAHYLFETTEPLLVPIRRVLPKTGATDLAPLALLLVLSFILQFVLLG